VRINPLYNFVVMALTNWRIEREAHRQCSAGNQVDNAARSVH
jgi:hypothetical protein